MLHSGHSVQTGHGRNAHLKPVYPYNHSLTQQTKGNGQKQTEAVRRSYQESAPIEQTIGILFNSFFPEQYEKDLALYQKIVAATGESSLHFTNRKCKLMRADLRSVIVGRHKDGGLNKEDMCIMVPVGTFEGGELWLPDLDIRIKYRPGSFVIMPACLLQHVVSPTIGQRNSLVYYSKDNENTILQNWDLMTLSERNAHYKDKLNLAFEDAAYFGRKIQKKPPKGSTSSWPTLGSVVNRDKTYGLTFGRYPLTIIMEECLKKKIGYTKEDLEADI